MSKPRSSPRFRFVFSAGLLLALALLVPAFREGDRRLLALAVLIPCALFLADLLLGRLFSLDHLLLSISLFLCGCGIAALAGSDPDAAAAQALRCAAGLAALLAGGMLAGVMTPGPLLSSCTGFLGLLLLAAPLFSPAVLSLTAVSLALLLIGFVSLLSHQGPVSALCLGLPALALLLVRGLPEEALLWSIVILLLLFASDGRLLPLFSALTAVILLFAAAFLLFPARSGPSSGTSMLSVLTASGTVGADRLPEEFPASGTASLFVLLTAHFGLIFSGLTALLFLPFTLRGTAVAAAARTRFHAVLAMGSVLTVSLRVPASLLSLFGVLPLSFPDLPLLTASLPDLCAQLFLIGMVCRISGQNEADLAEDAHLAMLAK